MPILSLVTPSVFKVVSSFSFISYKLHSKVNSSNACKSNKPKISFNLSNAALLRAEGVPPPI